MTSSCAGSDPLAPYCLPPSVCQDNSTLWQSAGQTAFSMFNTVTYYTAATIGVSGGVTAIIRISKPALYRAYHAAFESRITTLPLSQRRTITPLPPDAAFHTVFIAYAKEVGIQAAQAMARAAYETAIPSSLRSLIEETRHSPTEDTGASAGADLISPSAIVDSRRSNAAVNVELRDLLHNFIRFFRGLSSENKENGNKPFPIMLAASGVLHFLKECQKQISSSSLYLDRDKLEEIGKSINDFSSAASSNKIGPLLSALLDLSKTLPIYVNGIPLPNASSSQLQTSTITTQISSIYRLENMQAALASTSDPTRALPSETGMEEVRNIAYQKKRLKHSLSAKAAFSFVLTQFLGLKLSKKEEIRLLQQSESGFLKEVNKLISSSKTSWIKRALAKTLFRTCYNLCNLWLIEGVFVAIENKVAKILESRFTEPNVIFEEFEDLFAVVNGALKAASEEKTVTHSLKKLVRQKIDAAFEGRKAHPQVLQEMFATSFIDDFTPQVKWTDTFCIAVDAIPLDFVILKPIFILLQFLTKVTLGYFVIKPLEKMVNIILRLIAHFTIKKTALIEKFISNFVNSFSDYRNFIHPFNRVLYKQLETIWNTLQANYSKESEEKPLTKVKGHVREGLRSMLESFFETLEIINTRTQRKLKEHFENPSIITQFERAVTQLVFNQITEACSIVVSAVSKELIAPEERENLICNILITLNQSFRTEEVISHVDFDSYEETINNLISRILTHVTKTLIEKNVSSTTKSQQKATATFISEMKKGIASYHKELIEWINDQKVKLIEEEAFNAQYLKIKTLVDKSLKFSRDRLKAQFEILANPLLSNKARELIDKYRCLPLTSILTALGNSIQKLKLISDILCNETLDINAYCIKQFQKLENDLTTSPTEDFLIILGIIFDCINLEHPAKELIQKLYECYRRFYHLSYLIRQIHENFEKPANSNDELRLKLQIILGLCPQLAKEEKEEWESILQSAISSIPDEHDETTDPTNIDVKIDKSFFSKSVESSQTRLEKYMEEIKALPKAVVSVVNASKISLLLKTNLKARYAHDLEEFEKSAKELETLSQQVANIPHVNFEMGGMSYATEVLQKLAFHSIGGYINNIIKVPRSPHILRYLAWRLCQLYTEISE